MNKKTSLLLKRKNQGIRLDIAGGGNPQRGFVNIDIRPLPEVDIVHDLEKFPWPIPSESVSFAMASHIVEHIDPAHGVFVGFMNECWRVLQQGGQIMIATPMAGSAGYWQDPTHCNGCVPATFAYFCPLTPNSPLYGIYEPAPFRMIKCTYELNGNMEVAMEKMNDDASYHRDGKIHYK